MAKIISKKKSPPNFLKRYFWEIDFNAFDPKEFPEYTIERLLEYGDGKAIRWLRTNFPNKQIKKVISTSRQLSKRTVNFWKIILRA